MPDRLIDLPHVESAVRHEPQIVRGAGRRQLDRLLQRGEGLVIPAEPDEGQRAELPDVEHPRVLAEEPAGCLHRLLGAPLHPMAAYAFAVFDFRFKRVLFALILATLIIPFQIVLVPNFILYRFLPFPPS